MYNYGMNMLKLALERRGLTVADVARQAAIAGIPLTTFYKHCSGKRTLGEKAVLRYERLLGIPRYELRPDLWPWPPIAAIPRTKRESAASAAPDAAPAAAPKEAAHV